MVCEFLMYNKVNQLYIYIYPHISTLLHLPPTLPIPPLQVDAKHQADLPVLCSFFPLAIYFTFGIEHYIILTPFFSSFTGKVRSLSSSLWSLTHLTALYLSDNSLSRIPSDIAKLHNLVYLDLSSNKIRSLPAELGNMVSLRYTDSTQYIAIYPLKEYIIILLGNTTLLGNDIVNLMIFEHS